MKRPPILMTFEAPNLFFFFETLNGNDPCGKKPRCVSTRKNAYGSHVGLPRNDHEFMKKRSKALTEPLLKTRTLLETIFHYFWCILGSKNRTGFFIFLTFSAQGPPRPPKTPPDLSQDPPRAPQGHQKAPQDAPRRPPKHRKDANKGSKVPKIPPRRTRLPLRPYQDPKMPRKSTWERNTTLQNRGGYF